VYPREGRDVNKSLVNDAVDPDLSKFPLFAKAQGVRFQLHPGETLFVPAGWWHTARILSPSVTVSINGVNRANGRDFRRDYCENLARRSRLRATVVRAALALGQATRLFEV
jgi:ribosomal protein L16 Arg81 hydroxylase